MSEQPAEPVAAAVNPGHDGGDRPQTDHGGATRPQPTVEAAFADLYALFEGPLKGVSFPDVSREALGAIVDEVRVAAEEVVKARAALEAAQHALEAKHGLVHQRAQRALAYARVYAQDDAELSAAVARIKLPTVKAPKGAPRAPAVVAAPPPPNVDGTPSEAPPAEAPRRRGRPPKVREVPSEDTAPQH